MPHERDESSDTKPSSDSAPKGSRDVIRQAHDDIEAGQQDTDRHATPGLEKTRHRST